MACANYSSPPQALSALFWAEPHQVEIYCLHGLIPFSWRQVAAKKKIVWGERDGVFSERWACGSLVMKTLSSSEGRQRGKDTADHWQVINGPNSSYSLTTTRQGQRNHRYSVTNTSTQVQRYRLKLKLKIHSNKFRTYTEQPACSERRQENTQIRSEGQMFLGHQECDCVKWQLQNKDHFAVNVCFVFLSYQHPKNPTHLFGYFTISSHFSFGSDF